MLSAYQNISVILCQIVMQPKSNMPLKSKELIDRYLYIYISFNYCAISLIHRIQKALKRSVSTQPHRENTSL